MQTFAKKQMTVICERPILARLRRVLDADGVTGYTILPALAGRGAHGAWDGAGLVGDAGQMVQLVCILDGDALDRVLEHAFSLVGPQIGIITIQDVAVVRPGHF